MRLRAMASRCILATVCLAFLLFGSASARMGLLNHCDFEINQVHLPPEDFQFYSDWPDPPSWIVCQGDSISSHPATRHFWLFMQMGFGGAEQVMARAHQLRGELEMLLSNSDIHDDPHFRILRTEDLLENFRQDVVVKGGYFEVIVVYDPQAPQPNPMADYSRAYPEAIYFYLLVVYNLEIRQATDLIWSDFPVAISLSSFTAIAGQGRMVLEWTTESERQNLGFNVLRRSALGKPFARINEQLIPSASGGDSDTPQHYRFVDDHVSAGVTYGYQLEDVSFQGESTLHGVVTATPLTSEVAPGEFRLFQNHPNPFNASTEIRYQIPRGAHVILSIYDVRGELVQVLVDDLQTEGDYLVRWDGRTRQGHVASSGLYFCALEAGGRREVRKMVLLR